MDTALIDAGLSTAPPEMVTPSRAERLLTDALTRLRDLLLHELSEQIDEPKRQGRGVAKLRADPDTVAGKFAVDWELPKVMVEWREEAIEDIEYAPPRLEEGTYGRCERCLLSIPRQRLEAIPHARLCVPCQARRDTMG